MKRNIITAFAFSALALSASAQNYKVVVTTTDGEKHEYATSGVENIRFQEKPVYVDANVLIGAEYGINKDFGLYAFTIATGQPDSDGNPAEIMDIQLSLELVGDLSEDFMNAEIPLGYYRAGTGNQKWQFDIQKSGMWIRLDEGDEGILLCPIINGSVDVRRQDKYYDIRIELSLLDGGNVALSYHGEIDFRPGASASEDFSEDQNITFTGAQERYYANWFYPLADDATLELYSGSFTDTGIQTEGYWLNLPIYMPKAADAKHPEQFVADGVYTIEKRDKIYEYTNLPYTFEKGSNLDFWGVLYPIGTYVTYLEKNGHMLRSFINDGTVTVSNNGTKVELDLVTEKGVRIKGVYEGEIIIDDRNDSEKADPIEGTIEDDIVFDFNPKDIEMVGMSYPLGDYIKSGIYQFTVMITDYYQKHGDFLMLELSSDQEILPDGTYIINNEIAPFCGLKGFWDYGKNPLFSWYGNLDDLDEYGYQNTVAPIMGGTVTITTTAEDTRKLVFDLVDEDGHKLTGEYDGIFYDLPAETGYSAAKAPLKSSAKTAAEAPAAQAPLKPMKLK